METAALIGLTKSKSKEDIGLQARFRRLKQQENGPQDEYLNLPPTLRALRKNLSHVIKSILAQSCDRAAYSASASDWIP